MSYNGRHRKVNMKIAYCSDLHLEWGMIEIKNDQDADVLILAGDICVANQLLPIVDTYSYSSAAKRRDSIIDFFQKCATEFNDVIYIAGNHEHYNGDFAKTYDILKENLGFIKNLHILDKEKVTIGDVTFLGGTLWTDFNNQDEVTMFQIRKLMNDFNLIKNSDNQIGYWSEEYERNEHGQAIMDDNGRPKIKSRTRHYRDAIFTPEDAYADHLKYLQFILNTVDADEDHYSKFVVISHHQPSNQSVHPIYAHDYVMNGGYRSNLDFIIEDRPQIKCWIAGHTHHQFGYNIGMTKILCNPRGYIGQEQRANEFKLEYVDV